MEISVDERCRLNHLASSVIALSQVEFMSFVVQRCIFMIQTNGFFFKIFITSIINVLFKLCFLRIMLDSLLSSMNEAL
jgi:hypothetical protein